MTQRCRTVCTEEVRKEEPNESICHREQQSIIWKNLRKDLGLRAYKIQLVQEPSYAPYAQWISGNEDYSWSSQNKLFNNETHFWLNATRTTKLVRLRMKKIYKFLLRRRYIYKKSLSGLLYVLVESLGNISSKIMLTRTLQSIESTMFRDILIFQMK